MTNLPVGVAPTFGGELNPTTGQPLVQSDGVLGVPVYPEPPAPTTGASASVDSCWPNVSVTDKLFSQPFLMLESVATLHPLAEV